MKAMPNGDIFHPILAAYLIFEYVRWFERTNDEEYIGYARKIALLALKKAEVFHGALVFFYRPESKLSYIPHKFYSALTQAWYVHALSALGKHAGQDFDEALLAIYNSLLIPVKDGGCFIERPWGWIVEEYPSDPPLYTLNGWLTVVKMITLWRVSLERLGANPSQFIAENFRALEKLLPLYDAEFCANSRYQLTGFSRVKVVFDRPVSHRIIGFSVEIPGDGIYAGSLSKGIRRWGFYLERDEPRLLQFNVVRSLISFPKPNVFEMRCDVNLPCKAKIMVAQGSYRADLTGMPTVGWKTVAEVAMAPSTQSVRVDLAWDDSNLFAYPTNFKKRIDAKFFNAYHYIHITALSWLYARSGIDVFRQYALKWASYIERWGQIEALSGGHISHRPQNNADYQEFRKVIDGILNRARNRLKRGSRAVDR